MRGVFGVRAAFSPRPLRLGIGKKQIGVRRLTLWLACVVSLLAGSASAHDASSYGGVFRSRDLGAAWLNADVGLFLNAALVIAVDPRDSRSEEHTSELQSHVNLVCRLLLEKK